MGKNFSCPVPIFRISLFLLSLFFISCKKDHVNHAGLDPYKTETFDTLRFFVLGDWGRHGSDAQKKVAAAMNRVASAQKVNFILSMGDNLYPIGVNSTDDPQWETSFESVYNGPHIKDLPWFVALGNHDYLSDPKAEIGYSNVNSRWVMPDYFFTVKLPMAGGAIRIVVLDTSPFEKRYYSYTAFTDKFAVDTTRQKIWMDSVFSLNDANWTIVTGHHPVYTGGARVNEFNSVRNSLLPIFTKFNLPVYFAGHEHDLQHLKAPGLSVNQFVSGAGSEVRATGSMELTKFAASVNGFMVVETTRSSMDVYVIDDKTDTLYTTRILK